MSYEKQEQRDRQAWATAQANRRRTGYGDGGGPTAEAKRTPLRVDATAASAPTVAYGAVFTAADGTVRAYDIASGDLCWESPVDGEVTAAVSVADGTVFGGTRTGRVFALDAQTGEVIWTFQPDSDQPLACPATPTIHDGTVYAPCHGNGTLYALDTTTGTTAWAFEADSRYLACSPVVADDWVYVGDSGGTFYAVNSKYGLDEWTHERRGAFEAPPAAADGLILVNSDPNLHAFDAATGEQVWRSTTTHYGAPTVADDLVFVGTRNGVTGYDIETGDEIRTVKTDAYKTFSPALADGILYFATSDERIVAVDPETKERYWEYATNTRVDSGVTVADGAVFAVDETTGDPLYALTEDGENVEPDATVREMDIRSGDSAGTRTSRR